MSEEQQDKTLQQVDRLLEKGKPSNDEFLNMLSGTIPRADTAFQEALKQRLMAQLQPTHKEKKLCF